MQNILIAIVAVTLIAGGAWFVTSQSKTDMHDGKEESHHSDHTHEDEETNADTETPELSSGLGSLASLMAWGGSVRCDFTSTVEGDVSQGVFYTDGEKMRVEANMMTDGQAITSNMINDGEVVYSWGETPEGMMAIKMPNQEAEEETGLAAQPDMPADQSRVDIEQEVKYDCDRWPVEAAMFIPPSDVEFIDMQAMFEASLQDLPEGFELPEGFPEMIN